MSDVPLTPVLHGQSEDGFEGLVSLSLNWMTHDSHYDFKNFKRKKNNQTTLLESLLDLFETLTSTDWKALGEKNHKDGGYELLPITQMNPAIIDGIPDSASLNVDAVLVFRFNKAQDRLIGIRLDSIFYVLGFDFDFTLYHHGA